MISDGKMDVQLDVSKATRVGRLEVIEGPTGRRNRSAAAKAKIAVESLVCGATIRMGIRIASSADVPRRGCHCLARMFPVISSECSQKSSSAIRWDVDL